MLGCLEVHVLQQFIVFIFLGFVQEYVSCANIVIVAIIIPFITNRCFLDADVVKA